MNLTKEQFLEKNLPAKNLHIEELPKDASKRSYSRITFSDKSLILMDASKETSSVPPFIEIAKLLKSYGFSAPQIIAEDQEDGFLLIEDFGDKTYTRVLEGSQNTSFEHDLYKKAVDVLIKLHKGPKPANLPILDKKALLDEAVLLVDWYFSTLGDQPLSDSLRAEYLSIWDTILSKLHYKDSCLVLRDYHIDNLILLDERLGVESVGLLDFQDAGLGSYAYDLVSILEDARRDVPQQLVSQMMHYYLEKTPELDKQKFLSDYTILGLQRSCKIVGIFSRKSIQDHNNNYLVHLPRVWKYIRKHLNSPTMQPLKEWFKKIDAPIVRDRPEIN